MDNNMIGQRIRERRLHKKLTQKQLASLAKIRGSISELENSKYLPSAETLLNISQILDCSIEWILTGEDRISDNAIPEQLSDILPLLKQLSPYRLEEVKKFINYKLYEQENDSELSSTSNHGKNVMDGNSEIA
ncbi:MAG: helix-turn-helix transcriptional regulator [Enterocloster sp.]|uniref:helix-turn-helix transcriptional regulator n=1 Tax=Enterocloster clostridioformis TaxID=1531 RepID=UPI00232E7A67|nr:helix-turn-helix domain-containing protein [Enterocloster clostridioformis]MDB2134838.1 helix-turn-helix domain-containing protein [Enterocloster clostridioformis]